MARHARRGIPGACSRLGLQMRLCLLEGKGSEESGLCVDLYIRCIVAVAVAIAVVHKYDFHDNLLALSLSLLVLVHIRSPELMHFHRVDIFAGLVSNITYRCGALSLSEKPPLPLCFILVLVLLQCLILHDSPVKVMPSRSPV